MSGWMVVATLRRGALVEPEPLDTLGCDLADASVLREKKEPASWGEAMLERERMHNGWWTA